jgi:hypothetical protein
MFLMSILKDAGLEKFNGDGRDLDHTAFWAKYFNLRAVETTRRHFRGRILTDGYAVSVLVSPREPSNASRGKSDSTLEEMKDAVDRAETEGREVIRVGIDPGFDDVITASFSDERGPVSYSSAQYYEKAKIKHSNRRTSVMNEATKQETDVLLANAGGRTTDEASMASYLVNYLKVLKPLVVHRMNSAYRKLRFLRHVSKQHVVQEIVDLIVGHRKGKGKDNDVPLPLVLVGFGDWSGGYSSPISRKCAGPIQMIKDKIGRRDNAAIKPVAEYNTSKLDSQSWELMRNMRAMTHRKQKDGTMI